MKITGIDEVEDIDLHGEDVFQKILIHEREKAHNKGHQIMLVVLDVGRLFNKNWNDIKNISPKLSKLLKEITRDIDIKGWYLHNMLIGILYPGLYDEEKNAVINNIKQSIQSCFNPLEAENIKNYTLFFPNSNENNVSLSETRQSNSELLKVKLV